MHFLRRDLFLLWSAFVFCMWPRGLRSMREHDLLRVLDAMRQLPAANLPNRCWCVFCLRWENLCQLWFRV